MKIKKEIELDMFSYTWRAVICHVHPFQPVWSYEMPHFPETGHFSHASYY